jgi:hypothetical protein
VLKQMARRAGKDPKRAELLQQLGEAYLRAPERYPTAIVLAHDEWIPGTHILAKGDFKAKGEKVEPGFLSALNPGPAVHDRQRRKALAEWLTSPDQPLLARVMVNRIWQGHFGEGIVRTPNDFGRQGDPPTHPELLDWLAAEFAARGWSVKEMHRLIMLSSAYRQSSEFSHPNDLKLDPENRLLWRMNRSRLEGEQLWDAMHAVAGTLSPKLGGHPVAIPLAEDELGAVGNASQWPVAGDPAEYNRRGIYILNRRNFTYPLLQAFDSPDNAVSCPERDVTTVAPQALWFLNNNIAVQQAVHLAARLVGDSGDEPAKWVEQAWRLALARRPTAQESQQALALIEKLMQNGSTAKLPADLPPTLAKLPAPRTSALVKFCLSIFNLSEFLYVD